MNRILGWPLEIWEAKRSQKLHDGFLTISKLIGGFSDNSGTGKENSEFAPDKGLIENSLKIKNEKHNKLYLSEPGFDPGTYGLWDHHASDAPLWSCVKNNISNFKTSFCIN